MSNYDPWCVISFHFFSNSIGVSSSNNIGVVRFFLGKFGVCYFMLFFVVYTNLELWSCLNICSFVIDSLIPVDSSIAAFVSGEFFMYFFLIFYSCLLSLLLEWLEVSENENFPSFLLLSHVKPHILSHLFLANYIVLQDKIT